jgi:hypothetical protein
MMKSAVDIMDLRWFGEGDAAPAADPPPAATAPSSGDAPPAPPAGDPGAGDLELGEEWRGWWGAQLTKETREKHKDGLLELKGKQLGDVFDDYFGSKERYKNAVVFPGKDSKPEEIEAFLKRMDIPKTAEEYGFDPKQIPTPGTDEQKAAAAQGIAEFAKSIGLSKNQAGKLYQQYLNIFKSVADAGAARQQELAGTFEDRLLKDAGEEKAATETKEYFKRALVALGDKQLVKELKESGMLYSTAFVRGMADIWKAGNGEPPVVQGPNGKEETAKDALPKGDDFNKRYGSRRN